jgi:Uma2 family endonuclease
MTMTVTTLQRHRLTVDDYHKMGAVGILSEEDRVEMIEGEVIDMAPIGSAHAACVRYLLHAFAPQLANAAILDVQNPLQLDDHSEPQPDLMLLKPKPDFYLRAHPQAKDALLLVEVAETSAAYDQEVKIPLYARHQIPEIWLFDIRAQRLNIFLDPSAEGYKKILRPSREEPVAPSLLPGIIINWADALCGPL